MSYDNFSFPVSLNYFSGIIFAESFYDADKQNLKEDGMKSILIVEDNKDMQFLISNMLREEGFETIIAENGLDAVELVKKQIPDLILSDIGLPGINGLQVLKRVKQIKEELAVIIMSGSFNDDKIYEARKLGAADFISKPFDNNILINKVRNLMH